MDAISGVSAHLQQTAPSTNEDSLTDLIIFGIISLWLIFRTCSRGIQFSFDATFDRMRRGSLCRHGGIAQLARSEGCCTLLG